MLFFGKNQKMICNFGKKEYFCTHNRSRSGAVVARWAHNPKVIGSSPVSATITLQVTDYLLFAAFFLKQTGQNRDITLFVKSVYIFSKK